MPVGRASADILADIDDRVSSPSSGVRLKKVLKLLQYPGIHSKKFYRFKGEDMMKAKALNCHVTKLAGLCRYENLNKTDIIWSSTKAEDMEAALKSFVEATSWMDWWTFAMKSLSLKSTKDAHLVCHLTKAGARCQMLVAKMASTLWANVILKQCDAVLAKVKNFTSFESLMVWEVLNYHRARTYFQPRFWKRPSRHPPRCYMMRPSGRQFPGTSLHQEGRNCISHNLCTSSSWLNAFFKL